MAMRGSWKTRLFFRNQPTMSRFRGLGERYREFWRAFRFSPNKLSALGQVPWSDFFGRYWRMMLAAGAIVLLGVALLSLRHGGRGGGDRFEEKSALQSLRMTDGNSDEWLLEIIAGQPRDKLKQDPPGPPLRVLADVKIQGREASIGVQVLGQADEQYVAGAIKNSVWEPPPTFQILDEAGAELAAGRFKYG
jgi:hypothetical protein